MTPDEPQSDAAQPANPASADRRLYIPDAHWLVRVMTGVERVYCFQQAPGEEYYHLIVPGEIYVQSGTEKLCLNCALRRGVVTANRLFWQVRET